MDFRFLGIKRALPTVLVLGAGASRGASFTAPGLQTPHYLPPLDADYFRLLQRLPPTRATVPLLKFAREEYGPALDVSMERFYTEAEASDQFHSKVWKQPGPRLRRFQRALDWFLQSMPGVFEETIGDKTCEFHGAIVSALQSSTSDAVISYNYDCLIDAALRDHGGNSWRADRGYGFPIESGVVAWQHHGKGRKAERGIQLLKPHGSLNWRVSEAGAVALVRKPYAVPTAKGRIVPPSRNKNITDMPFVEVWRGARRAVASAKAVVMVGYSMPEQDLMSHVLLRTEARSGGPLEALVVVNPSADVRSRIIATLAPAIGPGTRVAQWETLGGFAAHVGDVPEVEWAPEL